MKYTNTNTPSFRKLRGYAFDPSFSSTISRRQGNEVIYRIAWEDTRPGPCGEYVEVIDYDPSKDQFYEAINLDNNFVMADHGLDPSEGDPRFHQQQVYAVVMSVIAQFEKALGRKIIWTRIEETKDKYIYDFVPLRIYPHALRQQNAYYSPSKMALLFGYFQASSQWSGNNVPDCAVFTCLSPDIVAHEVTHAILDSLNPYWRKPTNKDMLAFHEGFSDIIALLQRFTFKTVVQEQIRNSRGDLSSPENMLGHLAIQFGQAVPGNRQALRSFLVETKNGKLQKIEPDPSKYRTTTDPHTRGALLVAAVFDAFTRLYTFRVADLIRLATNGTGVLPKESAIPHDLVVRLSEEAYEIANNLMLICIRALDYCPPVDLTFGDYLRALVTADVEYSPEDEEGLRFALLESFRSWGIVPDDINTYSIESLMWQPIEECTDKQEIVRDLKNAIRYVFEPQDDKSNDPERTYKVVKIMDKILRETNRYKSFQLSKQLGIEVHNMFDEELGYYKKDMETLLGMKFGEITFNMVDEFTNEEKILIAEQREKERVFQVYRCRPIIRHNDQDGISSKLLIITFLQKVYVSLEGSQYQGYINAEVSAGNEDIKDKYAVRGGATLIIDLANYEIKYAIIKNITSTRRLRNQLDYAMENLFDRENAALLMQSDEPFAALHLH